MKINRTLVLLSTLLFMTISLAGYFGYRAYGLHIEPAEQGSGLYHGERYHVLLIGQEIDNPYWSRILSGAREAAREEGVYLEYRAPLTTDLELHQRLIELGTYERAHGILTQGLNAKRFSPFINRAIEAGVPVITVDTDAPESRRIAYVGTYNYYAGRQAGQELLRITGGKSDIGIITGSFETTSFAERVQGFLDVLHPFPEMRVVDIVSSDINRIYAAEKADQLLRAHPEITAFFGTSALDGPGIAEAIRRHHREGKVVVIAFDDMPETLEAIREGIIDVTIAQNPELIGYHSMKLMVKSLKGQPIAPINLTDTRIIR